MKRWGDRLLTALMAIVLLVVLAVTNTAYLKPLGLDQIVSHLLVQNCNCLKSHRHLT